VEFAVVASVYFVLVLGVIEFGRAFMTVELLNEAARRGCRVAIIEGTTSDQIRNTSKDFLTSVGINGETVEVIINDLPSAIVEAKYMPAYSEMTVQVTVPVASVTWVPNGVFPTGNLTGQFTMRRE
jgi:Flp pilus assembly protein TadG